MKLPARHPRLLHMNAATVFSALLLVSVAAASADTSAARRRDATREPKGVASAAVQVNRSQPAVSPPAALPVFSSEPSDAEVFQARLFAEPLVPIAGTTSPQENRALVEALQAYASGAGAEAVEPLLEFLERHPASAWRVALLSNLGWVYRRAGSFTRALDAWEEAWRLGKGETERRGKAIVDGALAQLAELNARLGRYQRLDELFEEIQGRPIGGSAGEIMVRVREGRWLMEHDPGSSFRCGPYALEHILAFSRPGAGPSPHLLPIFGS